MLYNILYRLGELLLALIVIAFVLYKLALSLDLVPEGFSPAGFLKNEYFAFKEGVKKKADYPNAIGSMSKILLRNLDRIEKYYADKQAEDANKNQLDLECREDDIYRFFMFLGGGSENERCRKNAEALKKTPPKPSVPIPQPLPSNPAVKSVQEPASVQQAAPVVPQSQQPAAVQAIPQVQRPAQTESQEQLKQELQQLPQTAPAPVTQ